MLIYKAEHKLNKCKYIGLTKRDTLDKRKKEHLKGDLFFDIYLQREPTNYEWSILEYCNDEKELKEKEIYYIKKYRSNERGFGFNIHPGGTPKWALHKKNKKTKEEERKQELHRNEREHIKGIRFLIKYHYFDGFITWNKNFYFDDKNYDISDYERTIKELKKRYRLRKRIYNKNYVSEYRKYNETYSTTWFDEIKEYKYRGEIRKHRVGWSTHKDISNGNYMTKLEYNEKLNKIEEKIKDKKEYIKKKKIEEKDWEKRIVEEKIKKKLKDEKEWEDRLNFYSNQRFDFFDKLNR